MTKLPTAPIIQLAAKVLGALSWYGNEIDRSAWSERIKKPFKWPLWLLIISNILGLRSALQRGSRLLSSPHLPKSVRVILKGSFVAAGNSCWQRGSPMDPSSELWCYSY